MNKKIFPFKQYGQQWVEYNNLLLDRQKTTKNNRKTKYLLGMWPYPSGDLHMGHVRNYTIVDILTRFYTLKNFEVFCPMGWDSFGLPAENAAKEFNIHPQVWTHKNINNMKVQLEKLFFLYNWKNEMKTCDKSYYQWQQKLFIEMWHKGYIEKKLSYIDYDPVDCTTLAKEQITGDGKGWRSGAPVEKRLLSQWFFKMSTFSEQLLEDLKRLEGKWPNQIITMQRNWIGKNVGYGINFTVLENKLMDFNIIEIFTKTPYYLPEVEFIAIGPDSDVGIQLYTMDEKVRNFITKNPRNMKLKTPDMMGFKTDYEVINPHTKKNIPVFIANYVLGDYGTGVVMGVPSVCKNDHDFAMANNIKIEKIIKLDEEYLINDVTQPHTIELTKQLIDANITYNKTVYKLKDWCISRQRYWGCPIPIIYCENCGMVENTHLPVNLSETMVYGEDLETICGKCGGKAQKEKDTMDTFVDSSWYQYRFPCANNDKQIFDENTLEKFPQVDIYVGGPEHGVLHLLFARFFGKMLKNMNYITMDEPFAHLFTQGMICMQTYKTKDSGMFVNPQNTFEENNKLFYRTPHGLVEEVLVGNFEKMSKSKKNTIDPEKMLDTYGVDALRLSVVSDTPANKDLQWNTDNLNGCWTFINRLWSLSHRINDNTNTNSMNDVVFQEYSWNMFDKIIHNIEHYHFNVAIANVRMIVNHIEENFLHISCELLKKQWIDLLILLWTICPVVCSQSLTLFNVNIDDIKLPFSRSKNHSPIYELVIQLDGKKYATMEAVGEDNEESILVKMKEQNISIKDYKKIIFIKNKVINFVTQ